MTAPTPTKIYELVTRVPAAGDTLGQHVSDQDVDKDPRISQRVRDAAALRAYHRALHETGQHCLLAAVLVEQGLLDLHYAEHNEILFASSKLATEHPFLLELGEAEADEGSE